MRVELAIARPDGAGRNYLTWVPVPGTVRLAEADGPEPVPVTLANADPATGGQVEFAAPAAGGGGPVLAPELTLELPPDGSEVGFLMAGMLGRPSEADGDAVVEVRVDPDPPASVRKELMVRIRKDADTLTAAERDRFTTALATLNDQGTGLYRDFREMHREQLALRQAHGAPGFLSWHRAYLLDLERELQRIDPGVTLPYWRFDRPAPALFTPEFLGSSDAAGNVVFGPSNLLNHWQTEAGPGISRRPRFDVLNAAANVSDEATTMSRGGAGAIFDAGEFAALGFDTMEGDPHGLAHTSFLGWLSSPVTAPRDPLFFLLHCNVDRLWARWQWLNDRFDRTRQETYLFQGAAGDPGATARGHNLRDTLWPWNGLTGNPLPGNAPRTPFPVVQTATAPAAAPTVGDMIDYQGLVDPAADMNFGYDDVPFGVAGV